MRLIIVESPAKSKTIEKYLGKDYRVLSSKGHIRDLATSGKYGLGVDVDNDFKPHYEVIDGKAKDVKYLKKECQEADVVILATDPDREGENISWHLFDELKIPEEKYERVVFNEITKPVVTEAIKHPGKIDMALVKSGETRRILDRIIGFRLSKLMQSKTGGKSAGRVQSVALKLIVDREREIQAFVPEEYWTIDAKFSEFDASLEKYKDKKIELHTESDADNVLNNLGKEYTVESIEQKEKKKSAKEVFRTSTLQQVAVNKLGFPASKTMKIAQKLYEGIDIGSETTGLITYMRTDSVRISDEFIKSTYAFIRENYGDDYVGYVKKGKKNELTQDAHEGIRPTSINRTPDSLKSYLSSDELKLYKLIYYRALASLMKDAKTMSTTVWLNNNDYLFKATGSVLTFDGYLKVYSEYEDQEDVLLPKLQEKDVLIASSVEKNQHFTKPAARYTESSLIKELEALGIGRPSTYATIIQTIKDRKYVVLVDKKFEPTEIGFETTDKLQEYFSDIINVKYTATMEEDLDKIAESKIDNIKVLHDFYDKFEPLVKTAFHEMEKKAPESTGEKCPQCGSDLVKRKYIKKEQKEEKILMACPKCSNGNIIEKNTRKGKTFWGCSNYPKCDYASWYKPVEEKCSKCGSLLVEKNNQIVCQNCSE